MLDLTLLLKRVRKALIKGDRIELSHLYELKPTIENPPKEESYTRGLLYLGGGTFVTTLIKRSRPQRPKGNP